MWPVLVVVAAVDAEDMLEMTPAEDEASIATTSGRNAAACLTAWVTRTRSATSIVLICREIELANPTGCQLA
jgi:hypothetical protein